MRSVIVELTESSLKPTEYRVLIRKKYVGLFPSTYTKIKLHSNDIEVMERTYNPKYPELSIGKWLRVHKELKPGDEIIIEVIKPMTDYRIRK
jgi:hypothetical protein